MSLLQSHSEQPLVSATFIPGGDSFGPGVGIPPFEDYSSYAGYDSYMNSDAFGTHNNSRHQNTNNSNSYPAPGAPSSNHANRDDRSTSASSNRNDQQNSTLRDTPEPMSPGSRNAPAKKSYRQGQYQALDAPLSAHPGGRQRASSANVTSASGSDAGRHWPLDRVVIWLAGNGFSDEWQQTFRALNLHGSDFLQLGKHSGGRGNLELLYQTVYPQLEKICRSSPAGWDMAREREEGKRMRRLIRNIADSDKAFSAGSGHRRGDSGLTPSASTDGGVETSPGFGRPEEASPPSLTGSESSPGLQPPAPSAAALTSRNSTQFRSSTLPVYSKQSSSSSTPSDPRHPESFQSSTRQEPRNLLNNLGFKGRHSPHLSGDASAGLSPHHVDHSPGESPSLGHAAPVSGTTGSISPSLFHSHLEHRRGTSTESVSRSRAATNGTSPGAASANDVPFATSKEPHKGFLSKFMNRSKKNENNSAPLDESAGETPTSPAISRHQTAFSTQKNNTSETSLLARPSSATAVVTDTRSRARSNSYRTPTRRFILVTPDQWNYRLIDATDVETAKDLRSLIYSELFIEDAALCQIFVTEPGQSEHQHPLTDDMLLSARQLRSDNSGNLKLFVRSPAMAGVAAPTSPSGGLGLSFAQRMQSGASGNIVSGQSSQPMMKAYSADATQQPDESIWERANANRDTLQKAAEDYRRETEKKQKAYLETRQSRLEPINSLSESDAIRGNRVVDFDSPRLSPFEDKKQENLIPQRKPPTAPAESTTLMKVNSLSKKPGERVRTSGVEALKRMSNQPIAEEPSERGRKSNAGSPAALGIGAALANVGKMAVTPATAGAQLPSPDEGGQKSLRSVDLTHHGSSGGTSPRPSYTWGKGVLFKNPEFEDETTLPVNPLPSQMPQNAGIRNLRKNQSPAVSPSTAQRPPFFARASHNQNAEFQETNVSFNMAGKDQSKAGDDSDDADQGLFAIPLTSKTMPEGGFDAGIRRAGKPALEVNTDVNKKARAVAFKSPSSSGASAGPSNRSSAPEDGSIGDRTGSAESSSAYPNSPDDRLTRRDSFVSDIWANRPAVENVVNHLDEFFPGVDLDQPYLEEPDSQPESAGPSAAADVLPTSLRHRFTYGTEGLPLEFGNKNESDTLGSDESTLKAKDRSTVVSIAKRQVSKSGGLGRMKSIREVAKRHHEPSRGPSSGANAAQQRGGGLLRRKSTKMFGANIVQIKPKPGNRLSTLDPIPQEEVPTEETPKRQATFKIIRGQLIGKGTYGRVYLGMNATTGEFLAVKHVEVNTKVAGQDKDRIKEMVAAMDQEIDTMQHLEHPNIVQYLGCERRELSISIYLEYIPGGSIGSCLRKHGKFEEPVVRSLTRQTLEGLAYLHGQGILHRDLKADNILLDLDGTCKISDFGISKKSDNIYGNDVTNSMQGSVFWMAPEVVRSQGQGYSAKVDVWSLGCVVLEMLAGKRPWSKEEAIGAIFKLGSLNQAPPIPDDVQQSASVDGLAFMYDCFQV